MSWNYRLVKYADGTGFGIHEMYYLDDDEVAMGEAAASFAGESAEEVKRQIMKAKMDASRRPVFEEPDDWQLADQRRSAGPRTEKMMENLALELKNALTKADAILGYVRQVPLDELLKVGGEFDRQISAQLSEKDWRLIAFALDAAVKAITDTERTQ